MDLVTGRLLSYLALDASDIFAFSSPAARDRFTFSFPAHVSSIEEVVEGQCM